MNDIMDMKISGSSAMPGGEYRTVSISGSGKVQGSLRCESLRCSGSAKVQGDVDCAGEIRCSGREEQAMMTTLAGLVVVMMMLVRQISDLFQLVKSLFGL